MNPPGDADTDGSPSNCTAFFISTAHDLSLYETHAPRSPPHNRDSLSLSLHVVLCFHLFLSNCHILYIFHPPSLLPLYSCLYLSLFFSIFVSILISVSVWVFPLLLWSQAPTPHLSSLAGSLVSADVPLVSGGLAGRQQKWLWDWGVAALLSLTHRTTLMSFEMHTYRVDSGRGNREEKF